jgi:AbrB family looped-hinge helix DNA binding protein
MNIQRGRLVSGGRLQVPAEIRRALGLKDGDSVTLEVVDGELRVVPYREVIRRIQQEVREHIPPGVSLVDELIADRRAEAAGE